MNFICGRKFQMVADLVYIRSKPLDLEKLKELKTGSIIYCKTDLCLPLFNHLKECNNKYILISHSSDTSVDFNMFRNKPNCIVKWFALNVNYYHPDLICLPLGFENDEGEDKGRFTDFGILSKNIVSFDNINNNLDKRILNRVYCNFTMSGSPKRRAAYRKPAVEALNKNDIGAWFTGLNYERYCYTMKRYKFVASPRGMGIDCYRTWEALSFGCIPIVSKHFMYDSYNLPIIQVEDWRVIDTKWLKLKYEEYLGGIYDYRMLDMGYWYGRIIAERDKLL